MKYERIGNTVLFGCPKCGTFIKYYAGYINEDGKSKGPVTCPSRQCDWKAVVKLDGYKPRTGSKDAR
jgi:hypothetical protein